MGKLNLTVLTFIAYFVFINPGPSAEIVDLQGRWTLVAISGAPTGSSPSVHFEIQSTAISGFDGCNSFAGSLDKPDAIIATQRACADGPPFDVSDLVRNMRLATLVAGRLTVTLGPTRQQFEFSKQDQ
ncbi:META domain-containing protein [Bradyrhizobium sp. Pa8]|uniref:META domain-containing protein n=1 Tax=Bradyrhizobium sp. Pa8 TaxID=3386552 RepID=UPI00403F3004